MNRLLLLLPLSLVAACAQSAASRPGPVAAVSPPSAEAPPPVSGTPALKEALARFDALHGVWKGKATGRLPDGSTYEVTQVERVGPLLGGDLLLIEGRGYQADGSTGFNAFAVVSFDPEAKRYEFRSYAQGRAGTFELVPTDTGFVWEIPAGPSAAVRFTSTLEADRWHEVGEYLRVGAPPVRIHEMTLTRTGATDWPLGEPPGP